MKPALVLLSDYDTDAPDLGGICTVSKPDAWDNGGWHLGVTAAQRGALWCDRPYWTGNPSPWVIADRGRKAVEAGAAAVQAGNEIDLPEERWQGGIDAYCKFWDDLHVAAPAVPWLWQPPGGGANLAVWVPGWPGVNYALHVYGSYLEMRDRVEWYLEYTDGDLFVTECNPGAGQVFDLNAWARNDLTWFLDWCSKQPRVKLVAYFAYAWDQSPKLPVSVDAKGTAVIDVLQAWAPASPQTHQDGQEAASASAPVSHYSAITAGQLGEGFAELYAVAHEEIGAPEEATWSVTKEGEAAGSRLETVRFKYGEAYWNRRANYVVFHGDNGLVIRVRGGKVAVLQP